VSILLIDGFDMYNGTGANTGLQAKWTIGGTQVATATGRFGGQSIQTRASGGAAGQAISPTFTASASVGLGVALNVTVYPTTDSGIFHVTFFSGATTTLSLEIHVDGSIEVFRATSTTAGTSLGRTAAGLVIVNTWHYLEAAVVINDTTGSVTLKLDGATILTLTGQDTNNAVGTVNKFTLGHPTTTTGGGTVLWDDLYLTDGATLGERRVETLRPAADTAQKDFTPNTGTADFSRVNETLVDGDTSYVQASVIGNRDLYTVGALSSTPTAIDAVQLVSFAEKTDATTRTIYNSLQSAGTDSDGTAFNLAASYGRFDRMLPTDPNGGGAWTASRVNGLQIGPKVAS
jgi:hypothetical protein